MKNATNMLSQLHGDTAETNFPSKLYILSDMPDVVHLGKSLNPFIPCTIYFLVNSGVNV